MKYNKELLNRFVNEKAFVAVRTPEEWEKFMQLLEEETDVKWEAGQNPTEYNKWDEYGSDSAITCGYLRKSRLSLHVATDYYKKYGYEIIEFKELIKGEEKMESTDYRELFTKTKIEEFVKRQYSFQENFENYKGHVISEWDYKHREYIDFLAEMKGYGIERDEIEHIIIKDYLTEKGKERK